MADPVERAAMTIGTSAALGTVLAALGGGLAPGLGPDDMTVGHMPGPGGSEAVLLGGASLWIVADRGDEKTAAAWDYIQYLVSAAVQSDWAASTGYVPVNEGALTVEPLATTYADDPRFRVAYDSLLNTTNEPWNVGPLMGPQREIRTLTSQALAAVLQGADVATTLADAAGKANGLLANYASLQGR
jgi:sn-glycerol 3-phosphate transport system substrate-binding protein